MSLAEARRTSRVQEGGGFGGGGGGLGILKGVAKVVRAAAGPRMVPTGPTRKGRGGV